MEWKWESYPCVGDHLQSNSFIWMAEEVDMKIIKQKLHPNKANMVGKMVRDTKTLSSWLEKRLW